MFRFIVRSLIHYRRTHSVVMLAVAVSTAVTAGALIVGDSIRASLREMTLRRLGGISHVLNSPRFVRQQLANELGTAKEGSGSLTVAPALMLTGSVEKKSTAGLARATAVLMTGLDAVGWKMLETEGIFPPTANGIVLGYRTALELKAKPGDSVSVWVELPSSIPRDSLLGEREETSVEIVLTVEGILDEHAGASRFSLQPNQQLPANGFIALSTFQERLGLQERTATSRNPVAKPARINTILVGSANAANVSESRAFSLDQTLEQDTLTTAELQKKLKSALSTADFGLTVRRMTSRGYLSVESESMILEDRVSDAVLRAAESIGASAWPTLVYLANEINAANRTDNQSRYSMYSIVAGLAFQQPAPLGPMKLQGGVPIPDLRDNEILLSHWLAEDLQVQPGETVQARWHEVGSHGDLPETHQAFVVRGILSPDDHASIDQDLTPFVDGVTNVDSFSDWDQPFEMEMDRITDRDDEYWEQRRATPKAFVSLSVAEKLWSSRFGRYTSIRVASEGVALPEDRLELLENRLVASTLEQLVPSDLGLGFRPVRQEGLVSAAGANDFSQLFLGFSFFLILSSILLASLMFQLSIRQRVPQVGLMEACGFTVSRARRFFVVEGAAVALIGSLAGCLLGVWFAEFLIHGLRTWWNSAVGTQFLILEIRPERLAIAVAVSLVLTVTVIWNAIRTITQRSPRELLSGLTSEDQPVKAGSLKKRARIVALALSFAAAVALPAAVLTEMVPPGEAFSGLSWNIVLFFLAGFAWLSAGLLLLRRNLEKRAGEAVKAVPIRSLTSLSLANSSRNPQRSLLTASLIACAAFVIVAVSAGRRNPVSELPDLNSGNGGFTLVAESSLPILFDLNSAEGRTRLGFDLSEATKLPEDVRFFGFRVRPGQDASCLNLFQTTIPGLLGASPEFLQRGGFRFASTPGANPWLKLNESSASVTIAGRQIPSIPVIGDMNTLQFSLKKGPGSHILFPDADHPEYALTVCGMLDSSIFQGVLVMSDANLKRIAPETSGFRYFLIETKSADSADKTSAALETALQPFGVDTERVSRRLAGFLAVQNTYLSTFQMLGGFGLLVGTAGLAAVMMRNVLERRAEIALLRALGFLNGRIAWLLLAENSILLFWGLLTGSASALIAMLPHLLSTGADAPWLTLGLMLLSVLGIGSLAVILPIAAALRVSVREILTSG